ncbi:unnamed protein product [Soboliphyme baturini]|uniref:Uncharacterized protein n=1 Tax=Soboliphyme baturini TaxID=241478 RepID=A0A183J8Q4_9BILA|nr:unnamed protein product [Soboliphyme baturini]
MAYFSAYVSRLKRSVTPQQELETESSKCPEKREIDSALRRSPKISRAPQTLKEYIGKTAHVYSGRSIMLLGRAQQSEAIALALPPGPPANHLRRGVNKREVLTHKNPDTWAEQRRERPDSASC